MATVAMVRSAMVTFILVWGGWGLFGREGMREVELSNDWMIVVVSGIDWSSLCAVEYLDTRGLSSLYIIILCLLSKLSTEDPRMVAASP